MCHIGARSNYSGLCAIYVPEANSLDLLYIRSNFFGTPMYQKKLPGCQKQLPWTFYTSEATSLGLLCTRRNFPGLCVPGANSLDFHNSLVSLCVRGQGPGLIYNSLYNVIIPPSLAVKHLNANRHYIDVICQSSGLIYIPLRWLIFNR